MKHLTILGLCAASLLCLPSSAPAAGPVSKRPTTKVKAQRSSSGSGTLSLKTIEKLLLDGDPGGWMFIDSGTGVLRSGTKVRMGSDYSGHCITYKKQGTRAGINLGHVGDCSQTKGGKNVTFELKTRGPKGGTIHYGDRVAMFINGNGGKGFVCYANRDHGINLNWGTHDADCKKLSGSKNNPAVQWTLLPGTNSGRKVGDAVHRTDRFVLRNVVIAQPMVKCARLTGLTTWRSGDLRWRKDCQRYELLWTHRELLIELGKDPKKLVRDAVPAKYRKYLKYAPGL